MPSHDLIIKNGKVLHGQDFEVVDIAVSNQKITSINKSIKGKSKTLIDASGKIVLPGGIDSHCHIEQRSASGLINSDNFYSATCSAASGGNTTVIPFAAQYEGESLKEVVQQYHKLANKGAVVDYAMHMIIAGPSDEVITGELPILMQNGHSSIKVFMTYDRLRIEDEEIIKILKEVKKKGGLVSVHAENHELINDKVKQLLSEGFEHPKYHTDSHPIEGEVEAIHRILSMSHSTRQPVMIFHVSSKEGLDQIRKAKEEGIKFFSETCTQYLTLSPELLDQKERNDGAKWICSPPIRGGYHSEALWKGLEDGLLDLVSSDHAPYSYDKRGKLFKSEQPNFKEIPNGMPGLNWRLPVLLDSILNKKNSLNIHDFVRLTSSMPAKIYGLYPKKGEIKIGSDADLVIWDTNKKIILSDEMVIDGSNYNPYSGKLVSCWPQEVILRGKSIVKDNRILVSPGSGEFLPTKIEGS
tara:strand:+ start:7016 stop:8422 length:1407 start_codon:yes stop_codon:yes gene_type:complete